MYPERHTEKEKKKDHSYSILFVWFVDDGDVDGMERFFRHKHHCRDHDHHHHHYYHHHHHHHHCHHDHHWERRLQGRVWVTWDLNQPPESRAPSCQHSLHHRQWGWWKCNIIDIIVIIFFGTLFITLFVTLFTLFVMLFWGTFCDLLESYLISLKRLLFKNWAIFCLYTAPGSASWSAMPWLGLLQITIEWFQTLKWTGWDGPLVC